MDKRAPSLRGIQARYIIEPGSEKFLPLAKRKVQAHFVRLQRGTSKDVPSKQVFAFEQVYCEIAYMGHYQWRVKVTSAATPNAWKTTLYLVAKRESYERLPHSALDVDQSFHRESDYLVVVSGGYEGKPYACWGITVVTLSEKDQTYDDSTGSDIGWNHMVDGENHGIWNAGMVNQYEEKSVSHSWDGLVPQLTLFESGTSVKVTELGEFTLWLGEYSSNFWQDITIVDKEERYTKVWNKPLKHGLMVKQFDEHANDLKERLLTLFHQAPRVTLSEADQIIALKSVRTSGMHQVTREVLVGGSHSSTYSVHDRIQRYYESDEQYLRAFHGITAGHPSYEISQVGGSVHFDAGRDATGSTDFVFPARLLSSIFFETGFSSDMTFGRYWEVVLGTVGVTLHDQITETCGGSRPSTNLIAERYPVFQINTGPYYYTEPSVAWPTPLPHVYRNFNQDVRLVEGQFIHALSADSVFQGEPTQGIAVLPSRIVLWGTQLTLKTVTTEEALAYLAKYPVDGPKLRAGLRLRLNLP